MKSYAKNLLLIVCSLLIVLVISELFLRIVGYKVVTFYPFSGFHQFDVDLGWTQIPGHEAVFQGREFKVNIKTNSHGYRDKDYPFTKPAGSERVVVLGDSFTWGWGAEQEEIFCEVAEKNLEGVEFINLGQSCIAPDYIVVHESQYQEFIDVMVDKIKISYGDGFEDQMNSDSLARIINDSHFNRLADIISKNKNSVIYGANHDIKTKFIQPTLINAETSTVDLLKEEIFGPLLPIVKYNSEDDLDKILCNIDNPLALYIFSNNRKVINRVESSTSSGSVCINDIAAQFINHNLPFGGVMGSGIGRYHGFSGFKEFSNIRTITHQSKVNFLNLLKAPYTNRIRKIADFLLRLYKNI